MTFSYFQDFGSGFQRLQHLWTKIGYHYDLLKDLSSFRAHLFIFTYTEILRFPIVLLFICQPFLQNTFAFCTVTTLCAVSMWQCPSHQVARGRGCRSSETALQLLCEPRHTAQPWNTGIRSHTRNYVTTLQVTFAAFQIIGVWIMFATLYYVVKHSKWQNHSIEPDSRAPVGRHTSNLRFLMPDYMGLSSCA